MLPCEILHLLSFVVFILCEDTEVYVYDAPFTSISDIPVRAQIVNQANGFNYSEQRSTDSESVMLTSKQLSVVGCGAVFTSPEIRIQSPQFPKSYPRDTLCLYVINAVSPNVCLMEVNFLTFDLGSCANGDSVVIAGQSLCGLLNGIQTFRFSSPGSLIQFRTGSGTSGTGFDLLIRQKLCPTLSTPNPQCSGVFSNPNFVIQSPGYPGQYPSNIRCQYVLRPALTSPRLALCIAEFNFEQFSIQSSQGCTGDRLQIGDQDVLCGSIGGIRTYQFLGELRVDFFASSFGSSGNFRIYVRQLGCTSLNLPPGGVLPPQPPTIFPPTTSPVPPTIYPPFPPTTYPPQPPLPPIYPPFPPIDPSLPSYLPRCCGKVYQSQYALLASPGFPFNSDNENIDCVYEIRPYNQNICRLKIVFKLFWVGEDNNYSGCWNGFLEIDGRRYCGCKTGTIIRSEFGNQWSGRQKYLRYKRDVNSRNSGGFLLEIFQESCSGWLPWSRADTDNKQSTDLYLGHAVYHTDLSSVSYSNTGFPNRPIQTTNCKNDISNCYETSYSYVSHSQSEPSRQKEEFSQSNTQVTDSDLRSSSVFNNRTNCKSDSNTDNESFNLHWIPRNNLNKKSQVENNNSRSVSDFRKPVIDTLRFSSDFNNSDKTENETTYKNNIDSIEHSENTTETIKTAFNKKLNLPSNDKNISLQASSTDDINNKAVDNVDITAVQNTSTIHSFQTQLIDRNEEQIKLQKVNNQETSTNGSDTYVLITTGGEHNNYKLQYEKLDRIMDNDSSTLPNNKSKVKFSGQVLSIESNNKNENTECGLQQDYTQFSGEEGLPSTRKNCNESVLTEMNRKKRKAYSSEVSGMYSYLSPITTSDRLGFLGESSCRIWGFAQWLLQAKQYFWNSVPDLFCPVSSRPRCQVFNQVLGWLQSSGYPQAYPSNSNTCYRFQRLQGYCQIQLRVVDFSLEYSNNCAKDYFLIGQRRYCGEQLASTYPVVLDISTTSNLDLTFVSDGYYSGRGFRIHYQYLPCGRRARATSVSASKCGSVISDKYFTLTQSGTDERDFCTYNILQNTSFVCSLQLNFSNFHLLCDHEYLQIGTERYCGTLSGQSADIQFMNTEARLVYRKIGEKAKGTFAIRGHQSQDCNIHSNVRQSAVATSQCAIQLSDIQGFVSFPEFELDSTKSGFCSYVIKPQEGMCAVQLKFTNFFVSSRDKNCTTRFMNISGIKFCNDQLAHKDIELRFNGSDVKVPFSVEEKTNMSDWNFTYTQLPCDETRSSRNR